MQRYLSGAGWCVSVSQREPAMKEEDKGQDAGYEQQVVEVSAKERFARREGGLQKPAVSGVEAPCGDERGVFEIAKLHLSIFQQKYNTMAAAKSAIKRMPTQLGKGGDVRAVG